MFYVLPGFKLPCSAVIVFSILFQVNRQPPSDHLSELLIDINSKVKSVPQVPLISSHSSPMYGKMSPPSMNIPNQKPSPLNTPKPTITAAKPATSKMSDPYMFTPGPHIAPVSSVISFHCYIYLISLQTLEKGKNRVELFRGLEKILQKVYYLCHGNYCISTFIVIIGIFVLIGGRVVKLEPTFSTISID